MIKLYLLEILVEAILHATFEEYLQKHVKDLHEKGIRIMHIGRKDRLPKRVASLFQEAEELTVDNVNLVLNLAIDYGGRDEIIRAIDSLVTKKQDFTENCGRALEFFCLLKASA